jgi:hypothetical protein
MAIWLAGVAAFALVAPPVAIAFAPADKAVHCLTHANHEASDDHAAAPSGHSHDAGHVGLADMPKQADHKSSCCGIFCVTAITPDTGPAISPLWSGVPVNFSSRPVFYGLFPQQPDRPPISRLPL